jgi:hypothetical protein
MKCTCHNTARQFVDLEAIVHDSDEEDEDEDEDEEGEGASTPI